MLDSIKLLKKDINIVGKLNKSSFFVFIYSFCMSSFIFNNSNSVSIQIISSATAYAVYGIVVGLIANEEKKKTSLIFQSIPVKKSSVVIGKYLFTLLIIIFSACISSIFPLTKTLVEKDISYFYLSFVNSIIFSLFVFSIFFPLYYSLGYLKMQPINLIIFYGFIFIPIVLNLLRDIELIRPVINFILDLINIINGNLMISSIVCILLYFLSMLLSIKLENNK